MAKQRKNKNTGKKVSLLLMLTTIVIIIILNYIDAPNKALPAYGIKTSETGVLIPYEKRGSFYTYRDKIFYSTNDGIQLIDENNDTLWVSTFSMKKPIVITDEGTVGICDDKGSVLNVYGLSGFQYSVDEGYPILGFSVNKNGFSSVIMQVDNYYRLYVYRDDGTVTHQSNFSEQNNIMPLSCHVSDDNRILAISFLDISDIKINSMVAFYYINKNENPAADENEGFLASYTIPDSIVSIVRFMENNNLVAVSDKEINFFKAESTKNSDTFRKEPFVLNNKLQYINFINKKNIAIALGEPYNDRSKAEEAGTVKWLDMEGSVLASYKADKTITYMSSGLNSTIIGTSRSYTALNSKGAEIWNYTAVQDISDIMFVTNTNTVLVVSANEARILKMNDKAQSFKSAEGEIEEELDEP